MKSSLKDKLQKIDPEYCNILVNIGEVASILKLKTYLVGGMVRDLLLSFDNLDIDIVVENDAALLSSALTKRFKNCQLSAKHDRFHTAKILFELNGKKIPVDLASTRQEIYEYPASLPTVRVSDLKKDLYRRDFTINALAVSIMPEDFGEIIDLFDGLLDLKNKQIRVLHDQSFVDDPTRMIRAVRFAVKLGFKIEEHTQILLKKAIDSRQFDDLIEKIRGDRVKIEIRYLFNLPNIKGSIWAFFESGIYKMVSTSLCHCEERSDEATPKAGEAISKTLGDCCVCAKAPPRNDNIKQWLIILALTMKDLSIEEQDKIMQNLQLSSEESNIIKGGFTGYNRLTTLITNNQNIDSIIILREFKNLSLESIFIIKLLFSFSPYSVILNPLFFEYLEKTSKIKLEITGDDLIKMGIKEGKRIGEILQKVLEEKIKNPSMKKEDEIKKAMGLVDS